MIQIVIEETKDYNCLLLHKYFQIKYQFKIVLIT